MYFVVLGPLLHLPGARAPGAAREIETCHGSEVIRVQQEKQCEERDEELLTSMLSSITEKFHAAEERKRHGNEMEMR